MFGELVPDVRQDRLHLASDAFRNHGFSLLVRSIGDQRVGPGVHQRPKKSPLRRAKPLIQEAWRAAVAQANIGGAPGIENTCAALDPPLWFFGVHGCGHCDRMKRRVPIGGACDHCKVYPKPK